MGGEERTLFVYVVDIEEIGGGSFWWFRTHGVDLGVWWC